MGLIRVTEIFVYRRVIAATLTWFILGLVSTPGTQTFFDNVDFLQVRHAAWAQTSSEIFPNATTTLLGNRSLIPGMHVMSLVNDVKSTWLIISSDNELSVNIRYEGTGNLTAPPVSLLATALKTTTTTTTPTTLGQVPSVGTAERLTGTNVTQAGWSSPITVPLRLEGSLSLYDADLIVVMIVPYTGLPLMNSTTPVLPQGNVS